MEKYAGLIEVLFGTISFFTVIVVIYLNYRANKTAERAIKETQLVMELENRPYVYFNILLEDSWLNFILVNKGKSVAKNIKFTIDQKLVMDVRIDGENKDVPVTDLAIFDTISFLTPGSNFKEFVQASHIFFQKNEAHKEITGKIEYESVNGKIYTTPVHLNLEALKKKRRLIESDFEKLVQCVERLEMKMRQPRREN